MQLLDVADLPRNAKRAIMACADLIFIPIASITAIAVIQNDVPFTLKWADAYIIALTTLISLPLFAHFGLYHSIVRFMGDKAIIAVTQSVTAASIIYTALFTLLHQTSPFAHALLFWCLSLVFVGGSRFWARQYINNRHKRPKKSVLIYGAGASGTQLVKLFSSSKEYSPIALIDDKRSLQRSVINGVKVHSPSELPTLITAHNVNQILLAMPGVTRVRRREIIDTLEEFPVRVRTIPELSDLVDGSAALDDIRDINIEDLLGRDPVTPNAQLMHACIKGKRVMVTGAGGSIGSELCRQIIKQKPSMLLLFDACEYALYTIEKEIQELAEPLGLEKDQILSLLGSVQDKKRLENILSTFNLHTIYHAAAYKHVPMVEQNIVDGVKNNIFGTWYLAESALKAEVETFVLVSTDKAVRPTNIMGATKRVAELVLQGLATKKSKTTFCMVRFGNVLGSSGSVVPLFKKQIQHGGPVTVTHPEVIRYFMTIPEAAQLVLQAGSLAKGGDVFVLDMGEPVKIAKLARKMIRLMGKEVKEPQRAKSGDIEIHYTGLRPGEKLYEELLIGDNPSATEHERIMKAKEKHHTWPILSVILQDLFRHISDNQLEEVYKILMTCEIGYHPSSSMVDHLMNYSKHSQQNSNVVSVFKQVGDKA